MPIIGTPRTFFKKFSFVVECDGLASAGFQKASELCAEIANVEHFEGGSLIPNKSPGRLKFSDVTLERGATKDQDLFDWFSEVADAAACARLPGARPARSVALRCASTRLDPPHRREWIQS